MVKHNFGWNLNLFLQISGGGICRDDQTGPSPHPLGVRLPTGAGSASGRLNRAAPLCDVRNAPGRLLLQAFQPVS
ncbi:MAG TPA: hypothetical protein DDY91_18610 [Planctomycetaceae bacterium]|nr:hypothetical protein [Planctomycetaceae bacterium]